MNTVDIVKLIDDMLANLDPSVGDINILSADVDEIMFQIAGKEFVIKVEEVL